MRPGATRDTSTEWVRGPLKIVLSRSHERLRFEHTERFEVITLNWKDGILRGDARYSELEHSDDEMAAWAIEGWNLRLGWSREPAAFVLLQPLEKRFEIEV